jgi:hypothetical protein
MSIRLDPRRVGTLKQLAADANMRPGDLVRQWVEERIDAARHGAPSPAASADLASRLAELTARVAALESMTATPAATAAPAVTAGPVDEPAAERTTDVDEAFPRRTPRKRVAASPSAGRIALHDEMIAVLSERGPMPAAELAAAVAERGRYKPPRSGKPLDAAMISQRVSNPTYRARFTRNGGRIGLAEGAVEQSTGAEGAE